MDENRLAKLQSLVESIKADPSIYEEASPEEQIKLEAAIAEYRKYSAGAEDNLSSPQNIKATYTQKSPYIARPGEPKSFAPGMVGDKADATGVNIAEQNPSAPVLPKPMTLEEIYQTTAQGEDLSSAYWAANLFPRTLEAASRGSSLPVAESILDLVSIPGRATFADQEKGIEMGMSPEEAAAKGATWYEQIGMSPDTYVPTPGSPLKTIAKTGWKAGMTQAAKMGAKQGAAIAGLEAGSGDLDKAVVSLATAPIFGAVQGAIAGGLRDQASKMVTKYMRDKGLQPTKSGVDYILSKVPGVGSTASALEKDLPRAAQSFNIEDRWNTMHPNVQSMRTPEVNNTVRYAIESVSASRAANKLSKEQADKAMLRIQEFAEDYKDLLALQSYPDVKLKNPMVPQSGLTREQKVAFAERYKDVPDLRRAIVEKMGLGDEYTHATGYINYPRSANDVDLTKPFKSSVGNIWQPEHIQRASNVVSNAPRGAGIAWLQDLYGSEE
ncbi:MAG: hypothetical protein [Bacteriophage sp.]|nr:MAG: hypothetical protein [Bacteriophage sp.]